MKVYPGILLQSSSSLDDPHFEEAIILITEHNDKGAMGFVVNKLFPRSLNELQEFSSSISFPLYDGGPVDREHLFFMHRRPDLIQDGVLIHDGIYLGGDFKQAVACINDHRLSQADIKIFIGYCGWDNQQLEEEIEEGSWMIAADNTKIVFNL